MEQRKRIIELLNAVRFTTNDIEKVADELHSLVYEEGSFIVFEDGADEGIEGMIQLSIPFKTLEQAETYSNSWRGRKTYVAKIIEQTTPNGKRKKG